MAWSKTTNSETKKKSKFPKIDINNFKPATELKMDNGLKMGIYAKSKIGKSMFALTAPRPLYFIDTEFSIEKNVIQLDDADKEGVHIIQIDKILEEVSEEDFTSDKYELMKYQVIEDAVKSIIDLELDNGTIVIDSGSDMYEYLNNYTDLTKDVPKTKTGDTFGFSWGKRNKLLTELMDRLGKTKMNVLLTFKSKAKYDSTGNQTGENEPHWFKFTDHWLDLNTEMTFDGKNRWMHVRGDRYGNYRNDIKNPDWNAVVDDLKGKMGVEFQRKE